MIREEDVGDIYATTAVQPPDYRIVLLDGTELLIEVKNCHHLKKPLRLKSDYVARLENYGRVLNRPVKLAIYWSRWCVWTMVPLEALRVAGAGSTLSFPDAMMTNEMAVLGDHMIGTTPPLAVRFLADPTKPRKATPRQERVAFTIGGVENFRRASFFAQGDGSKTSLKKRSLTTSCCLESGRRQRTQKFKAASYCGSSLSLSLLRLILFKDFASLVKRAA